MNRYALLLLLLLSAAWLTGCGSAGDDPAQRVEKPMPVAPAKGE